MISENEYLLKINKELVDDNNNLTEALKKTYADIAAVINIIYEINFLKVRNS